MKKRDKIVFSRKKREKRHSKKKTVEYTHKRRIQTPVAFDRPISEAPK